MCAPGKKLWRALVRVHHTDERYAWVIVPGWNHRVEVPIELDSIPAYVRENMVPDYRCYAKVNIGAEKKSDLVFKEWELP